MSAREEWTRGSGGSSHGQRAHLVYGWVQDCRGDWNGVYRQSVNRRLSIPLAKHVTVFQVEVYVILTCIYEIETQDWPEKYVFALIARWL
jgi:hypothetical protein